jgi:thiol peroxidase
MKYCNMMIKGVMMSVNLALQGKIRKVGDEAPAVRVTLRDGTVQVVGMMADKVQVIMTFNVIDDAVELLNKILDKYNNKANIYIVSSQESEIGNDFSYSYFSYDFEQIAKKFGVYISENQCANSICIINKDGEIVYIQILDNLTDKFDYELLDSKIDEAIKFKKKGHHHENWMGV